MKFQGNALFYFRGRLAGEVRQRGEHWLITLMVVDEGNVYFPTVVLPDGQEPPEWLRFDPDKPTREQLLITVIGIPQTRNVSHTVEAEIGYLLRRAGFPGVAPLLTRLLPKRVREAEIKRVLYNFVATDISIEDVVTPDNASDTS